MLRMVELQGGLESELCIQVTRRLSTVLRAQLHELIALSAAPPERLSPEAKAAIVGGNHQAVAAQVPLTTSPPPKTDRPGRTLLATGIGTGRRRSDGAWVLRFDVLDAEPVALTLRDDTLHAFVRLVTRALAAADWALPNHPADASAAPPPTAPSRELH